MKPELYRNIKYTGATLLVLLLLSGADCELGPKCDNGQTGAVRTLSGMDATIVKKFIAGSLDNDTYTLTINTPDPYLHWTEASDVGNNSISCFSDYWDRNYGDDPLQAVVWLGSTTPLCATIQSLKYSGGVITAVLKRPDKYHTALTGSGEVVININQSCNPSLPCQGSFDLTGNCYQPFFTPENTTFTAPATGATLNFATFDGAWMPDSDLSGTALSHASFVGVKLIGCNFDNSLMVYTDFTGADMTDAHAYGARVYNATAPNGTVVNSYQSLLLNKVGYSPASSTTTSIQSTTTTSSATSTTSVHSTTSTTISTTTSST